MVRSGRARAGACRDARPLQSRLIPAIDPLSVTTRFAAEADRPALAGFRCSAGLWYEDEVELEIRERLLDRTLDPQRAELRPRVQLFFDPRGDLAAVGAFEIADMRIGGVVREGTYIRLLAVRLDLRGARLPDGRRLADVALRYAIFAGLRRRPRSYVLAVAARDHVRSIEMCREHGLVLELADRDPRYVMMFGFDAAIRAADAHRRDR